MDASSLADDLAAAPASDVVRLVADWMHRAETTASLDLSQDPPLLNVSHLDALVAAAAAQVARTLGMTTPPWTIGPSRMSASFWHPGSPALFANALVHAPGEFSVRGVFIEAASLVSV